jgi:hypothetical protein
MLKSIQIVLFVVNLVFLISLQNVANAQTKTSAQTGNFTIGSTWVGGIAPANGDNIIIKTGHTVTLDATGKSVHDITIEAGAIFDNGNFDLTIFRSGGNPTYKNDGIHNSGTGNLILFNNFHTRVRGTGVSNINFNVRDYGIQPLFDCDLTINGNLQHNASVTYQSRTLINNSEGGTFTINGDIIPHPSKGITIINQDWETYEANITINGNADLSTVENSVNSQAGTIFDNYGKFTVTGDLLISPEFGYIQNYGEITIGGDLLGSGTGDDFVSYFDNQGLLKIGGNIFPAAPNLGNLSVGLSSTVEYFGNSHQTIFNPWDHELNPDGPYNNLIINNSSLAGVTFSDNITVNGTFSLNNGYVHLSNNNLILGESAVIGGSPSSGAMVIATGSGELRKNFNSASAFTFPVGNAGEQPAYTPLSLSFDSGTFSEAYVGVNLSNTAYPGSSNNYLKRFWNISGTGITDFGCDALFQYAAEDVVGNESLIYCFMVSPETEMFSQANSDLQQLSAGNLNALGTFTGKEQENLEAPYAFNVLGGGTYCESEAGLPVGLDGSQQDVSYTLYKNSIPQTPTIQGTGVAISFGTQLFGTYTISGTNAQGTIPMNGFADIIAIPVINPSVSIMSNGEDVCQGASVAFTAFPENGGATPAYQWKVNGQNAGTNNSTFTYSPLDGDQVQVVMTSSLTCVTGNPASSNVIAMTVTPNLPAGVSISATQNSVCQGTSVTFTAFPENGGTTPAYQWKVNGQNAGTNTSTFNYTPLDDDQVQVVMTSSLTCVTGNPASSNVIAMTVNPNLPAGVSISATQNSVCQGASVAFTAFPENGGTTPAYQWKVNGQNAGTNTSTFNYTPLDDDQVQGVMTSSLTCITGNPASSNVIAMTVTPNLPAGVSISATQNSVCQGTSVTFTAFPENGGATPAYQWKVNGQNAGTNNSTFTYSPLDGDQVQVVMTSSLTCITGNPASSNVIAMTVTPNLPAGVSISATQNSVCQGTSVTFTAFPENGGTTPAYQWKVNGQNAGTNNSTFTYSPLDGDQVQVVMTSSLTCITGNPASSNVIAMTVTPNLPAGVSISATQNSVCQGTSVTITAFPENGGATPAYQWKVNGQNAGTNNSTFTYSPLDGDQVQVVMTSSLTCVTGNPASSNVIAMTVTPNLPASVSISATQNSFCQGNSATFTAFPENGGATPAYQWKVNGQNAGINTSTFTYSPLDDDQVQVVMTSSLTCITGNPASSNVIAMTVSNSLPASVSISATQSIICYDDLVIFTAFPENGGATPAYQWKVNGQNTGINNSTFTYSPLDGDQVQVVMTSSLTCVTGNPASSNVIAMTVNPNLPAGVSIATTQNSVCQGTSVSFTALPENGGATPAYQWKVNGQNAGINNSTFTYSPLDGDQVQVVMTSSLTCVTGNPASSNVIAMTVSNSLPASVSISATQSIICYDDLVIFTAFPENGGATPAYQWKVNGQNAGINNSTFTYSPLDGDQVQVVMTSSLTCVTGNPASSNVIAMTVSNSLPASVSISVTQSIICYGDLVIFTAFPENGGAAPAYQWKVNGQNAGTNNSTFTYSPLDGDQVQVVMTSLLTCISGNPASSNVIAMTVSNSLPAGVSITTTQNSVCQGTPVSFTAFPVNDGAAPSYQWKVNGQNAGNNNSTFTYSPLDGDQVQVVMTSSLTCISGNPASSNVIAMTVSNSLPAGVSITTTQNSVCQGTPVSFTAFPENGGVTPAYQWKVNGQNAGTNNSAFNYAPNNNDQVQVVMTSSSVCVLNNPAISNTIEMAVNPVEFSLIANPMQGGTVNFTGTPLIGQSIILTAVPANGWVFANWTNNLGDVISTNAIFNFAITVCNQTITANFNTTNLITGKLAYFNPLETSIPTPNPNGAFYVQIFDNMIPASSPQQIVTGMPFSFSGLETGKSYTMRLWEQSADNLVGNTWTWNNYGGVTALDALIVSYMGIQNPVLSSFPWILSEGEYTPFFMNVADANNSSSITSLDALILLYRSIGDPLTIPFPGGKHNFQVAGKKLSEINEMVYPNAPDILFNPSGIYAASSQTSSVFYEAILPAIESGTSIFNIYLVATGDVNVSYDLVNQTKLKSALSFEGVTVGNVNDEMLIPVKLKHSSELAAASIAFSYSHDIVEVVDIVGIDVYSIDHNEGIVRIAWMDEKGKFFDENDQLFSLKLRILKDINEGTSYLELLPGTEFSDKSATVLNDVVLTANYIETSPTSVLDMTANLH